MILTILAVSIEVGLWVGLMTCILAFAETAGWLASIFLGSLTTLIFGFIILAILT